MACNACLAFAERIWNAVNFGVAGNASFTVNVGRGSFTFSCLDWFISTPSIIVVKKSWTNCNIQFIKWNDPFTSGFETSWNLQASDDTGPFVAVAFFHVVIGLTALSKPQRMGRPLQIFAPISEYPLLVSLFLKSLIFSHWLWNSTFYNSVLTISAAIKSNIWLQNWFLILGGGLKYNEAKHGAGLALWLPT